MHMWMLARFAKCIMLRSVLAASTLSLTKALLAGEHRFFQP